MPADAEVDLETLMGELYFSPFEAAAEYDAWAGRLIGLLESGLGRPAELLVYKKLTSLYRHCIDTRPLDTFFESFADRKLSHGFVRLRALSEKKWALTKKGRIAEANALGASNAYARNVLIAGPFGFYCRSLHDVPFPPEKELDAAARYRGYAGDVGWQIGDRNSLSTAIDPYDFIYPRAGCCYALYQFFLPAETPAVIAFEYGGSSKVWFNDSLLLDQDRDRAFHPSSNLLPVTAAAGWNRVLVKLTQRKAPFTLLVTDRAGWPIEGMKENRKLVVRPVKPVAFQPPDGSVLSSIDSLEAIRTFAASHGSSAAAQLALADSLVFRELPSRGLSAALAARDLAPSSAHVAHFLGCLYLRCSYLPQNFRNNRSREMFEKALAIDADFLPARVRLAQNDHKNDRSEEAIESLRTVLAANPSYYRARMALVDIYSSLGWQKERTASAEKAIEIAPLRDGPIEEIASFMESLGRTDLAQEHYRTIFERNGTRTDLMRKAADFAWERGNMDGALALCDAILSREDSEYVLAMSAQIRRAMGDIPGAIGIIEELCRRRPGNPGRIVKLADILLEEGDRDKAIRFYEKALAIAPDLHKTRALLGELGVSGYGDDIFDEYLVNGGDFMTSIPGKEKFPRASSILALDHQITRVYTDGSSRSRVHQVVKILDKNAVENYAEIRLPGRVEIVRTIAPDGRILEPVGGTESGSFLMPGIDVGCIVETCFTLREADSFGKPLELGNFYYQDAEGKQPFIFSRNVVILPKDFPINEEIRIPALFEREVIERGEDRVFVYTARNTPVVELENSMPPDRESFPNTNFIQYRDWIQLAQIMANIHNPDIIVTDEIRRKAIEIAGGVEGDVAKAKELYSFVNDLVKDENGSDEAVDVLLEECGNRGNLYMALLDAAGVGYDCLRCGVNAGYRAVPVDWNKVDLDLFPQELIRIHGTGGRDSGTLVSMNNRMALFGEIPPYLRGAPAVKVTGRPERIERIPGGDPIANRDIDIVLDVAIEGDDAAIKGTLSFPGYNSSNIKEQMTRMDTNQRKQAFEYGLMRSIYPGARVISLEITGIDEVGAIPTFTFELQARNFVQPSGDEKACRLIPKPPMLTRTFIRKPTRRYPMIERGYSSQRFAMTVDVGDGYRLERLPASIIERSYFLNCSLITARTDSGYRIEQVVEYLPGDVKPTEYPDLITRLTAIDERAMEPVILSSN